MPANKNLSLSQSLFIDFRSKLAHEFKTILQSNLIYSRKLLAFQLSSEMSSCTIKNIFSRKLVRFSFFCSSFFSSQATSIKVCQSHGSADSISFTTSGLTSFFKRSKTLLIKSTLSFPSILNC